MSETLKKENSNEKKPLNLGGPAQFNTLRAVCTALRVAARKIENSNISECWKYIQNNKTTDSELTAVSSYLPDREADAIALLRLSKSLCDIDEGTRSHIIPTISSIDHAKGEYDRALIDATPVLEEQFQNAEKNYKAARKLRAKAKRGVFFNRLGILGTIGLSIAGIALGGSLISGAVSALMAGASLTSGAFLVALGLGIFAGKGAIAGIKGLFGLFGRNIGNHKKFLNDQKANFNELTNALNRARENYNENVNAISMNNAYGYEPVDQVAYAKGFGYNEFIVDGDFNRSRRNTQESEFIVPVQESKNVSYAQNVPEEQVEYVPQNAVDNQQNSAEQQSNGENEAERSFNNNNVEEPVADKNENALQTYWNDYRDFKGKYLEENPNAKAGDVKSAFDASRKVNKDNPWEAFKNSADVNTDEDVFVAESDYDLQVNHAQLMFEVAQYNKAIEDYNSGKLSYEDLKTIPIGDSTFERVISEPYDDGNSLGYRIAYHNKMTKNDKKYGIDVKTIGPKLADRRSSLQDMIDKANQEIQLLPKKNNPTAQQNSEIGPKKGNGMVNNVSKMEAKFATGDPQIDKFFAGKSYIDCQRMIDTLFARDSAQRARAQEYFGDLAKSKVFRDKIAQKWADFKQENNIVIINGKGDEDFVLEFKPSAVCDATRSELKQAIEDAAQLEEVDLPKAKMDKAISAVSTAAKAVLEKEKEDKIVEAPSNELVEQEKKGLIEEDLTKQFQKMLKAQNGAKAIPSNKIEKGDYWAGYAEFKAKYLEENPDKKAGDAQAAYREMKKEEKSKEVEKAGSNTAANTQLKNPEYAEFKAKYLAENPDKKAGDAWKAYRDMRKQAKAAEDERTEVVLNIPPKVEKASNIEYANPGPQGVVPASARREKAVGVRQTDTRVILAEPIVGNVATEQNSSDNQIDKDIIAAFKKDREPIVADYMNKNPDTSVVKYNPDLYNYNEEGIKVKPEKVDAALKKSQSKQEFAKFEKEYLTKNPGTSALKVLKAYSESQKGISEKESKVEKAGSNTAANTQLKNPEYAKFKEKYLEKNPKANAGDALKAYRDIKKQEKSQKEVKKAGSNTAANTQLKNSEYAKFKEKYLANNPGKTAGEARAAYFESKKAKVDNKQVNVDNVKGSIGVEVAGGQGKAGKAAAPQVRKLTPEEIANAQAKINEFGEVVRGGENQAKAAAPQVRSLTPEEIDKAKADASEYTNSSVNMNNLKDVTRLGNPVKIDNGGKIQSNNMTKNEKYSFKQFADEISVDFADPKAVNDALKRFNAKNKKGNEKEGEEPQM